ncbi:MAG: radical SAM family heme chaperone HemW [Victivallaceae bacterium]
MVKDLSVYVHIPFCRRKCHYCSFYTVPYKEASVGIYADALLKEWEYKKSLTDFDFKIVSLFFGGGTPALLPAGYFEKIIRTIGANKDTEITLEANPEDLTPVHLKELKNCGISRLSIGVQTFRNPILKILGREHTDLTSELAIIQAFEADFRNISIDMIYGLPHQTQNDWKEDLMKAVSLPLNHISIYNLTIDPHTVFYKYRRMIEPHIISDEEQKKMLNYTSEVMNSHRLKRYEIASYAFPGYASIHNLGYWTGRDFIGLGVSASQYLNGVRSQNIDRFSKYIRGAANRSIPQIVNEKLSLKEREKESLSLQLRIIEGIPLNSITPTFLNSILHSVELKPFLEITDNHLKLNLLGLLFHDTVAGEIMSL